jgi:hypothetical protein
MSAKLGWIVAAALCLGAVPAAAKAPDTWDGLYKIKSKKLDVVYLLPEADFRPYSKVMIDPPQLAFRKNWQRDQNSSMMGVSGRISDKDVAKALQEGTSAFSEMLHKAYSSAGYQIVTEPGPDVLRVSTAVINIDVQAPDRMMAGRSRTYSREAGQGTLAVEVRDSTSNALMGRALDQDWAGDTGPYLRNSVSNRFDFEQLFEAWAKSCAAGLQKLKDNSPINAAGLPAK